MGKKARARCGVKGETATKTGTLERRKSEWEEKKNTRKKES